ncbi:MAG: hypothetical protein H0X55_03040 [Thermoleophilaceae bacterium]|nr:hypothetical protein [Thermoleophilaceae bacterium]
MLETPPRPAEQAAHQAPCPRCGAPSERGQLACLSCGAAVGLQWRRPSNWKVPAVLVAVIVVAIGAGIGVGLSTLTADPDFTVTVPSSQPPPPPPGRLASPAEEPAGQTGSSEELEEWPADERGYTVILSSSDDEQAAQAEGQRAAERGIDEVGVLSGREHAGLDPNLFIVFADRYDSSRDAREDADDYASQGYGDAYPRLIEPPR